jgi:hypothetical protein
VFAYIEHVENIADSESQPTLPALTRVETYPGAGTLLCDYIAEPWERDAQSCLDTNLQDNPYYPSAMRDKYKYTQCGIKMKGMKSYYDKVLREEDTALRFRNFKNEDCVQKFMGSMPDDHALGEWKLHTREDMRWNDNYQPPFKSTSRDIIKSIRWLMRQPANAEHLIFAPPRCFNSNMPPICLYTEIHTGDC